MISFIVHQIIMVMNVKYFVHQMNNVINVI